MTESVRALFAEFRTGTVARLYQSDMKEMVSVEAGAKVFDECMDGRHDDFAADPNPK